MNTQNRTSSAPPPGIHHGVDISAYNGCTWPNTAEMPRELRAELLMSIIAGAMSKDKGRNTQFFEIITAHIEAALERIGEIRIVQRAKASDIEEEMDHSGDRSTVAGVTLSFLPSHYFIGGLKVPTNILLTLSGDLAPKERPYIKEAVTASAPEQTAGLLSERVAQTAVGALAPSIVAKAQQRGSDEPQRISLADIQNMDIEEFARLDSITMKSLLEGVFDNLESLYSGQISDVEGNVGVSSGVSIPEGVTERVIFWIGFIHGMGKEIENFEAGELRVLTAFRMMEHSIRQEIIEAITPCSPDIDGVGGAQRGLFEAV